MKLEEFNQLLDTEIIPECRKIMNGKGLSYSGLDDKLGNFKRVAEAAGVPTIKVWQVYFLKHVDAINSYCRGEYNDTEDILGRIKDIINYGYLAYAIIKEDHDFAMQIADHTYSGIVKGNSSITNYTTVKDEDGEVS